MEGLKKLIEPLKQFGHDNKALMGVFMAIGFYTVASTTLNYSWRLFKTFLRPGKNLYARYEGGYVVVTGATFGLGLEYANQFGEKGFNLVLIARNKEKLDVTKEALEKKYKDIDIKTIVFNFDIPYTKEGYQPLKNELLKLTNVSVLINNVGAFGSDYFNEMPIETMNTIIQVNCIPQMVLTKLLLPKLLKRSKDDGKR